MPAPRRIIALLGAAAMLAGAPAVAFAQEDPTNVPPLSSTPPGEEDPEPAPPPPPPPPPSTTTAPERSQELPNTGTDPRVLALLGSSLLLTGIGLRMRAPDGRF